ncbi:MAG: hypothetical protein QXW10_02610 [Candidatus Micrarchaeaceae archaeon]
MKTKSLLTLGSWLAVIAAIIAFEAYMSPAFASSSSNAPLNANVNVGNVIYIAVANVSGGNVINFGSIFPDSFASTNFEVTDNDPGGNIGANIFVSGTTWTNASTSNTFGISNTSWSATSSSTNVIGTPLSNTPTNTNIHIIAPSIADPITSNIIYFGMNVPAGTPPGNYLQTISFENENASQDINSAVNTITAKVAVQSTCYIALSTNAISFGSIVANANVPTNVIVTDTDNGGNVQANLLVAGTSWTGPTTSFGVSNTLWSNAIQTSYTGNALTSTLATTPITIPAPNTIDSSTSNSIYFGLGIPGGTPAGSYSQTITIENSC